MNETRCSLIARVRDLSDQQSWREFEAIYRPLIERFVCKYGVPYGHVADVVQDVFCRLMRALPNFELDHAKGRFRSWLGSLTRYAAINKLRELDGNPERPAGSDLRGLYEPVDPHESPSSEVANADQAEWDKDHRQQIMDYAFQQVRDRVKAKTWACFNLHLVQGMPATEVAQQLGMPYGTVTKYASRVLSEIREICRENDEEIGDA